ncbi:MAG: hypothetical protein A3F72_11470 [Bacteroidetes bacterium RIFCSPLOWO2_12_FULL_35_15]|nr:MAG: hypothetical protein A3F72_11470 [Bacteroidetes bacterium RIFCSPLOWO2_12_FULL_35_15]
MLTFNSIKELIKSLDWSKDLLSEMFEKRNSFSYKYEMALEILEEDRIEKLIEKEVLRRNGAFLEIDEKYLQFFELVLEVNEQVSTAFIHENIQHVKESINYYLKENGSDKQYSYLKVIKSSLQKIGRITHRSIIDLNRNIENTFKTEPTYKVKIAKLENFDIKRKDIEFLIQQTEKLVTEEELTFFKAALDEELKRITNSLRIKLNEGRHNLIETQKQIINYLNQIKQQSEFIEKIRQIKYLRDQFELKSKTNFLEVLSNNNSVIFEPKSSYPLKLSIDYLQTDEAYQSILKISKKFTNGHKNIALAEAIEDFYLVTETEEEIFINLEEVKNGFMASGNNLYDFVQSYRFPKDVSFEERLTFFCQMISQYENEFNIADTYNKKNEIEFVMVYPKNN